MHQVKILELEALKLQTGDDVEAISREVEEQAERLNTEELLVLERLTMKMRGETDETIIMAGKVIPSKDSINNPGMTF